VPSWRPLERALTAVLLGIFACAPALGYWLDLDATPRVSENRAVAAPPGWPRSREAWLAFPRSFDAWVDDHFGFRNRLLRWSQLLKVRWFRVSPTPNVILGKQGWLFLGGDVYERGFRVVEEHRGLDPYSPADLAAAHRIFRERALWSATHGMRYLVVFMPNKETIYPELLPAHLTRVGRTSRLDQLMAQLETDDQVNVLDLRGTLLAAKSRERVYDTTGTHWNQRGAFAADRVVAEALAAWFPGVRAHSEIGARRYSEVTDGGGLAVLMGMPDVFRETQLRLDVAAGQRARLTNTVFRPDYPMFREPFATWTGRHDLPRAVVFHDSSILAIRKYLAEHFSRAAYYWQYEFSPSLIDREGPDLVLQVIGERALSNGPPENAPQLRRMPTAR
jgi:alginate O-acetyltransferase complex protein AlgJ